MQLVGAHLAAGDLPRMGMGDIVEATPAVHVTTLRPARTGRDRWRLDERGRIEVRGEVAATGVDQDEGGSRVDVLDVAGRLVPMRCAPEVPVGRVHVEGSLFLDPDLAPGPDDPPADRRRYRVLALRRYRLVDDRPVGPVVLRVSPAPHEADERCLYLADLRPEPVAS